MSRPAIYLACCLILTSWYAGFAAEDLFDTSKPIVEIEWRGQANMRLRELGQQPDRGQELGRVMQERGLSQHDVRTWIRHQLIVRDFIDRRVRLFIRIPKNQIVQYYQDHQQTIGEPVDQAIREQIGRLLAERQVNVRLTELLGELCKKGNLDFPP